MKRNNGTFGKLTEHTEGWFDLAAAFSDICLNWQLATGNWRRNGLSTKTAFRIFRYFSECSVVSLLHGNSEELLFLEFVSAGLDQIVEKHAERFRVCLLKLADPDRLPRSHGVKDDLSDHQPVFFDEP